jgi:FAD/FMN-containing dehydrogenase
MLGMRSYCSWGRYPRARHSRIVPVVWRTEPPRIDRVAETVLPYAYGRSYGDSCLNDGGALLDVSGLDRLIAFDEASGLLRCETGVTLAAVLALTVPRGWFLPVVPGTRWVSVGGAIANDIHGKNHHRAGTFGCHITQFELLRSTGQRVVCSPDRNPELFRATIGGLGLTGLILWAEIRLKPVPGPGIVLERIRFRGLDEFFELSATDQEHEYTVAWVDCLARGRRLGRGIFMRGDHVALEGRTPLPLRPPSLRIPFDAPAGTLNRLTMGAFNELYYRGRLRAHIRRTVPYVPFFFPLDGMADWTRLYGSQGLVQYQCVVPDDSSGGAIRAVLDRVNRSSETPTLAVLKRFGSVQSPGLLSFPRPGVTLAVDFGFRGPRTLRLLEELDQLVRDAGGAVYPAKDARMSPASFRTFFPSWQCFAQSMDPKFSSSFWRRVQPA